MVYLGCSESEIDLEVIRNLELKHLLAMTWMISYLLYSEMEMGLEWMYSVVLVLVPVQVLEIEKEPMAHLTNLVCLEIEVDVTLLRNLKMVEIVELEEEHLLQISNWVAILTTTEVEYKWVYNLLVNQPYLPMTRGHLVPMIQRM